MKGIVLIPCYNRPEFLTLVLDFIKIADGSEKYIYYFLIDHGYDKDIIKIINKFLEYPFIILVADDLDAF